jgi:hypothetical protein
LKGEKGEVQVEGERAKGEGREVKEGLVEGVRLTTRALWRICKASVLLVSTV